MSKLGKKLIAAMGEGIAIARGREHTPSLDGFIVWLETKNPDELFNLLEPCDCAFGQYYQSLGLSGQVNFEMISRDFKIPAGTALGLVFALYSRERTFGSVLIKVRQLKDTVFI